MPAKILLVDDDLQSLKLVGLMLQRRGHTILAARGGAQALEKAEADQPDLIILDIMMPDLDGLEVCRHLRSSPRTSHIPVILFTAKVQVGDKVAGFQAGADDYLTKPIHPDDLAARVEAVLQHRAQLQADASPATVGQVIGFLGAKGGVGTTTLALNVAAALVKPSTLRPVMFVDLQSSAANVAVQLGLTPGEGLAVFAQRLPQEITPALVRSQLMQHASGLQLLLSAANHNSPDKALSPERLSAVVNSLTHLAQQVVIDLGSTLEENTVAAAKLCQRIVLAVEPQRVALAAAQNVIAQLDRHGIGLQRLIVAVVNRTPGALTLTKLTIEAQLKLPVTALLPPVPEVASEAAQDGRLILQLQPGSLIADQIRTLAQHLTT